MNKIFLLIILVAIIGAGAWAWQEKQNKNAQTALVTDENAVLVSDQQPGDETIVTYAKLAKPGYVVIRATDTSGTKVVLGASDLLPAGEHRNVHVRHRSGTSVISGTAITAEIIVDNGDGTFDEASDNESVADDGAIVDGNAELDLTLSDNDLSMLLDDAGYTTEASTSSDEVEATNDESEDTSAMDDDTVMEDDSMMSPTMEASTSVEGATE